MARDLIGIASRVQLRHSSMALSTVLQLLDQHPTLRHITTFQLLDFLRLSALLKRDIDLAQPASQDSDVAPAHIPESVSLFLSRATGLLLQDVPALWSVFKEEVWAMESGEKCAQLEETTFKMYGWPLGISAPLFFGSVVILTPFN